MEEVPYVDGPATDGTLGGAQVPAAPATADEVSSLVSQGVTSAVAGTTEAVDASAGRVVGTLGAALADSESRVLAALGDFSEGSEVAALTMEEVLAFVPEGGPTFATSFLAPLLWGIGAGLLMFLIGSVWESFMALLGMSRDK